MKEHINQRILMVLLPVAMAACTAETEPGVVSGTVDSSVSVVAIEAESALAADGIGIDLEGMDSSVPPHEDFFAYANGTWLDSTPIPADRTRYGNFNILADESQLALRNIIEEAAAAPGKIAGTDAQKVGDFYTSFMDTARLNDLGAQPLEPLMKRVDDIGSKRDLIRAFADFGREGVQRPLAFFVNNDLKQTDQYAIYLTQSGLGLPDRDDYFTKDERSERVREGYMQYVETMFQLAGFSSPEERAKSIMDIESRLAQHHWTRVQNRDRNKTYNRLSQDKLAEALGAFDWGAFVDSVGWPEDSPVIVRQPGYLNGLAEVVSQVQLDDWKDYLRYKIASAYAPYLSQPFLDAEFDFYRRTLRGAEAPLPRWKDAVDSIDDTVGELVGKVYVAEHFPPRAKERMRELVENLRAAMRESLEEANWMDDETRTEALSKLEKFNAKIGYPDEWVDYSELEITPDDLLGNVRRASAFEHHRALSKLGGPIRSHEWFMTPQTVNAYYNPAMNEIVFPAAIMQPPFFDLEADDAANYGAIGAVIGHELGHGFDDQGRKTDGEGELRDWWSKSAAAEYEERAQRLIQQYSAYEPIEGMPINGELTLGENIGDLGGVSIAYRAYQKSLNGQSSPVIQGMTGEQRFFVAYAQAFRVKHRGDELARRIKTDPHAPGRYRVNGVVPNLDPFYKAFDVVAGQSMYLPQEERVRIW